MNLKIETIDPTVAKEYLRSNTLNRPLRATDILTYSRLMKKKEWALVPDPIIFDEDRNLLNGQHRLHAICQSGYSGDFYVMRGAPTELFHKLDTGAKRSAKDILFIAGYNYPSHYGALINNLIRYKKKAWYQGQKYNASLTEILAYGEKHKGNLAKTINACHSSLKRVGKVIPIGAYATLYHLFRQKDEATAFEFFSRLAAPETLPDSNVVKKLYNQLMVEKNSELRIPIKNKVILTIKAWNAYRSKKSINTQNILFKYDIDKNIEIQ